MSNERLEWINKRAYEIWEEHGRPDGQDQANWEQANREFEATAAVDTGTPAPDAAVNTEQQTVAPAKVLKPKAAPKKAAVAKDPDTVAKKPRAKPSIVKT